MAKQYETSGSPQQNAADPFDKDRDLSPEERAAAEANSVQAEEQARVAKFKQDKVAREKAERAAAEAEEARGAQSGRFKVRQGQFVQMQGATWFKCSDVNVDLNRNLSAIAVALEDFEYDAEVGAANNVVKVFFLRRYFTDPNRPQQCYTHYQPTIVDGIQHAIGLDQYFKDLRERGKAQIVQVIEPIIRAGVKAFEEKYRDPRAA